MASEPDDAKSRARSVVDAVGDPMSLDQFDFRARSGPDELSLDRYHGSFFCAVAIPAAYSISRFIDNANWAVL